MTFRIYHEDTNGHVDSFDITEDTIKNIIDSAHAECESRGWDKNDCWSEKLKDGE